MRKQIYIAGGVLAVGLGFAGIFLPVLPTTPFLLLAMFCFTRSSTKLAHWLLNNKLLGPYVQAYISGRGMPVRQRNITIILLWVTIITSIFLVHKIYIRLILMAVAIGVTIHLFMLKSERNKN